MILSILSIFLLFLLLLIVNFNHFPYFIEAEVELINNETISNKNFECIKDANTLNMCKYKFNTYIHSSAVDPIHNKTYVGGNDGNLYVIDKNNILQYNFSQLGSPYHIDFDPIFNITIIATDGSGIYLLNTNTMQIIHRISKDTNSDLTDNPYDLMESNYAISDLTVNPNTHMAYAVDYDNNVYVIDIINKEISKLIIFDQNYTSITKEDSVTTAHSIVVNPNTNIVYVAFDNSPYIGVIDGDTNTKLPRIQVSKEITDMFINPNNNKTYAVNKDSNRIYVIDSGIGKVVQTLVGNYSSELLSPTGDNFISSRSKTEIVVDPNNDKIYTIRSHNNKKSLNSLFVVDNKTNTFIQYPLDGSPKDIHFNPISKQLFFGDREKNIITVINTTSLTKSDHGVYLKDKEKTISALEVEDDPVNIAINTKRNLIYIIHDRLNKISVIDANNNDKIIDMIKVDTPPSDMDINEKTNKLYINGPLSNITWIIDTNTNEIIDNITGVNQPTFIDTDPHRNLLYIMNQDGQLYIIDDKEHQIIKSFKAINGTTDLIVDYKLDKLFMSSFYRPNNSDYTNDIKVLSMDNTVYRGEKIYSIQDILHKKEIIAIKYMITLDPIRNIIYAVSDQNRLPPDFDSILGYTIVNVIDGYSGNLIKNFTISDYRLEPTDIAVNPNLNTIYVSLIDGLNENSGVLSIINSTNGKFINNITLGFASTDVEVNPETNFVYVANLDSNSISVINGYTNKLSIQVLFTINPPQAGYIECNGHKAPVNQTIRYDIDTRCKVIANTGYKLDSFSGNLDSNLKNSTFKISNYGTLTANFIHPPTFLEDYGNIISSLALVVFIIIPTLFSAKPELLSRINRISISKNNKKLKLADIDSSDILGINVAVIAGVLIFLSLEGFTKSEETQINLITANIVFPFAISAIATLLESKPFGTRFMIAGFVNLMVSVILIILMRF